MIYSRILFLLFLSISSSSQEPRCSKYDFEEKVLEKMVRVEFQLERMKYEMEQTVKTVENIRTAMDTTLDTFDTKLKSYDENIKKMETFYTNFSETLNKKQQEHDKSIEYKFGVQENKTVETISEKIQELETIAGKCVTETVAFKATLDSDTAAPGGHIIVFKSVLFNEGDAYNPATGKFTASVDGTYMFSIAFCVISGNILVAGIMVDGKTYTVTLFKGSTNNDCSTADTVAVLKAGQLVWVEVIPGGNSGTIIDQDASYRWNTFSGTLIHK